MKTFNKICAVVAVLVVFGLMAGPAYPQSRELLQLQRDVLDLKNTVNQIQASMDEKNQAILSLVEKMTDQVNGLTGNVSKINSTVDNVNSHTDKSSADLRALVTTLTQKLNDLTDNVAAIRSQLSGVSQQITAAKTEPLPGPDDNWRAANLDLTVGNYDLAIQELSDFQNKYPSDPRAGQAQILKGDALAGEKKYDQAVIEYDTFLQKYPESDDTRRALYKKGLAQAESDPKAATATLQQVVNKYKGTVEAANAQAKLKELAAPATRKPPRPGRQN
jgi:TolA-binding protein